MVRQHGSHQNCIHALKRVYSSKESLYGEKIGHIIGALTAICRKNAL